MASPFPTAALRNAALALAAASLCACGSILLPAPAPAAASAAPPSHSVAEAGRKLEQAAAARRATEARYAGAEQVCYAKFFVNHCLDAAKEERRASLATLRAIEIEAGRYQRQAVVDERDRALAEAEREYAASRTGPAAEPAVATPPAAPGVAPTTAAPRAAAKPAASPAASPAARPAGVREARPAQERLDAAQRAANAQAFEKRRLESERRKRAVAERKAEKAAKAAREAAEAKEPQEAGVGK